MTDDAAEVATLQSALAARTRLQGWATGVELITVLRAAEENGWLDALAGGIDDESLAALGGVSVERTRRVVDVLVSGGVVAPAEDASWWLTPEFAALHGRPSGVTLPVVLDSLDADRARLRTSVTTSPPVGPDGRAEDALVVARDWALLPGAAARVVFGLAYDAVPQYRDQLAGPGRLLDVGSGLGGALLNTLTLFPESHAVGIEQAGDIVTELIARARTAGVLDRLEVRHLAAQNLADESAFDACYWAQAFFAPDARAPTLAAIRRALVPGGAMLVQELVPPPGDEPSARTRCDLAALVADTRGITPACPAEALAEELTAAGFVDATIVASPVGRLILAHAPHA